VAASLAITFEGVARELLTKNQAKWSKSYAIKTQSRFERHVFPWIGSLRIAEIEAPDVLAIIQRAEDLGHFEMAHKIKALCGQVFRFGVATGRIKSDPSRDLQGALAPVVVKHRATITEPKRVGALLRAIQGFEGTFVVKCALAHLRHPKPKNSQNHSR